MKNIFLSIFAAVVLVSCGSIPGIGSKVGSSQPSIIDSKWVLADNVKGISPTMVLESGRVNGNSGCNNFFGELVLDATAGNFKANNVASTKKACEDMSVETNFLQMLQEANKYVVSGNTLELYKNQLLLMKFNRQ